MTSQEKEQKYLSGAYGGVARTAFLAGRRSANAELAYWLKAFVDYYTQAGIGDCKEGHDDDDDQFNGDEKFNVRNARAALAALEPKEMTPNA